MRFSDDQTIRLLTDWLDAHTQRLEERHDGLAERLNQQDKTLAAILEQAKETNGRVTHHDHLIEKQIARLDQQDLERERHHTHRLEWRHVLFGGACVILSGGIGELLHLLA